jgi:hypothetical protein
MHPSKNVADSTNIQNDLLENLLWWGKEEWVRNKHNCQYSSYVEQRFRNLESKVRFHIIWGSPMPSGATIVVAGCNPVCPAVNGTVNVSQLWHSISRTFD